jgi:hypothetical protein
MYGVSETQRQNAHVQFSQRPGAYTARAVDLITALTDDEKAVLNTRGQLPAAVEDKLTADGFDPFLVANGARQLLAEGLGR